MQRTRGGREKGAKVRRGQTTLAAPSRDGKLGAFEGNPSRLRAADNRWQPISPSYNSTVTEYPSGNFSLALSLSLSLSHRLFSVSRNSRAFVSANCFFDWNFAGWEGGEYWEIIIDQRKIREVSRASCLSRSITQSAQCCVTIFGRLVNLEQGTARLFVSLSRWDVTRGRN